MSETNARHPNLATALAAFQSSLPTVAKNATGQVGQNRNYKYADLADISAAAYPRLAEHGLSFISKPTINAAGTFVLAYSLLHESGEREDGEFPLPEGTMQQLGSAVTYSRRYSLCAVTGIVPDEDDDGQSAGEYRARPPQQRSNGQQQRRQQTAEPSPQESSANTAEFLADEARKVLRDKATSAGVDLAELAARFEQQYGETLKGCADHTRITAFMKLQNLSASSRVAANGASR